MKNLTINMIAVCMLLSFAPKFLSASARTSFTPITTETSTATSRSTALTVRLNEIDAMDKSNMTFSEKKQLRKEVRSTKQELRHISGGVYLSAGTIILVLILLIVLL